MKSYKTPKALLLLLCIFLISIEHVNSIKVLKEIKKFGKELLKQFKEKEKTRNNEYDDSVVYAIPTSDGQGYVLYGYGKLNDPYFYDKDVNIRQAEKMWSGRVRVPNFLGSLEQIFGQKEDRIVRGSDNRYGVKINIPYLGDFQYIREAGPGRFVDELGPGRFQYPGYKSVVNELSDLGYGEDNYDDVYHGSHYTGHRSVLPGIPQEEFYKHSLLKDSPGKGYGGHSTSGGYGRKRSSVSGANSLLQGNGENNKGDPFASLRNYGWL